MCIRRKSNPRCDPAVYFAIWYAYATLFVALYVQFRFVLLPGLCALDLCWPNLGCCAFDVNRTRFTAMLFVGLYVQSWICLLYTSDAADE